MVSKNNLLKYAIMLAIFYPLMLPAQTWLADTFKVNPQATYLLISSDAALPATAYALDSADIRAGDWVLLQRLGDFDNGPNGDTFTSMIGIFSRNDTLLPGTILNRVAGAVDAGNDIVTSVTWYNSIPTDVAEDFFIDSLIIQVPDSARYIFLSPADSWFQDNSDPDGDFALRIMRTDPPPPLPPVVIDSIADVSVREDSGSYLIHADVRNVFSEAQSNDTLTYSVQSAIAGISVTLNGFELSMLADSNFFGYGTVTLSASNSLSITATDTFSVRVSAVNDPPQINGLPDTLYIVRDSVLVFAMHDYDFDIDTADSLLSWSFQKSSDSMTINYDSLSGLLQLYLSDSWEKEMLICTVTDDSMLTASYSIYFKTEAVSALSVLPELLPGTFKLLNNYPNPFNPQTKFALFLNAESEADRPGNIFIYNTLGQWVASIDISNLAGGYQEITYNGKDLNGKQLPSGVYFAVMRNDEKSSTLRITLMR